MAAVEEGEALFNKYSAVSEEEGGWLTLRDIVLSRKMPRRMLVQPLTVVEGTYINTPFSREQSWVHNTTQGFALRYVSHVLTLVAMQWSTRIDSGSDVVFYVSERKFCQKSSYFR